MRSYVYSIQNKINLKIYIGKTNNPVKRFASHRSGKEKLLISRAVKKYGQNNFIFQILEEYSTEEEAFEAEEFFINYFSTCNRNLGYNLLSKNNFTHLNLYRPTGIKNANSKLTDQQVIEIYNKYVNEDFNTKDLETMYAISDSTVNGILSGKTWKHLNLKALNFSHTKKYSCTIPNRKCKLNKEQVIQIRKLSSEGCSNVELCKIFYVNERTVSSIVLRKTWKFI